VRSQPNGAAPTESRLRSSAPRSLATYLFSFSEERPAHVGANAGWKISYYWPPPFVGPISEGGIFLCPSAVARKPIRLANEPRVWFEEDSLCIFRRCFREVSIIVCSKLPVIRKGSTHSVKVMALQQHTCGVITCLQSRQTTQEIYTFLYDHTSLRCMLVRSRKPMVGPQTHARQPLYVMLLFVAVCALDDDKLLSTFFIAFPRISRNRQHKCVGNGAKQIS
jgi:hypothetical protein